MTAFFREYQDVTADQLSINYRSTQQIVDTLIAIAPQMGASEGMIPLAFTADRGSAYLQPEIRVFDTLDDEAGGVAASIRELETAGGPLPDQAVLLRSNSRLNEIAPR